MKKHLFWLLTLLVTSLTLVSCSKDDEPNGSGEENEVVNTGLIGLWSEDPTYTEDEFTILDFKKDGTLIITVYWDWKVEDTGTLSYSVIGDKMTWSDGNEKGSFKYSIKGDKLTLYGFEDDDEDWTFTRVKAYPDF